MGEPTVESLVRGIWRLRVSFQKQARDSWITHLYELPSESISSSERGLRWTWQQNRRRKKKPSVGIIQPSWCMCLTSSEYSLGGQTGFKEGILSSRFTILADKGFWFVYHGIVLDRSEMFGVNVDEPKQATPPCGPKKPPPKPCPPQPTCPPPQQHPKPSDPCAKAQPCKTPCKPPQRPCGPQKPTPDPKKPDLRAPLFKALKVSVSLLDSHLVKAVSYFWSRISYHGKCQTMMSLLLLCQG